MVEFINFSIFEIDHSKLLESDHRDLADLSAEDENTITVAINKHDIDEGRKEIQAYIDKDKKTFMEMMYILIFYITSGKYKFTDKMLDLFTNGPKPGNTICIFIYSYDQLIFVHGSTMIAKIYESFEFKCDFYNYDPLPKDRIRLLKEGFKKDPVLSFKYVDILY